MPPPSAPKRGHGNLLVAPGQVTPFVIAPPIFPHAFLSLEEVPVRTPPFIMLLVQSRLAHHEYIRARELEIIQSQMAQKPMLLGEVGALAWRV